MGILSASLVTMSMMCPRPQWSLIRRWRMVETRPGKKMVSKSPMEKLVKKRQSNSNRTTLTTGI